jgi:hypothetical protein
MRSLAPFLLLGAACTGCLSFERVDVKVARRSELTLEKTSDDHETILPPGDLPMKGEIGTNLFAPNPFAQRHTDSTIDMVGLGRTFPLVDDNGDVLPAQTYGLVILPDDLPSARSETFRVPLHADRHFPSDLAIATPWSNVESVKIRNLSVGVPGLLASALGLLGGLGGAGLLYDAGHEADPDERKTERGVGLTLVAVSVVFLVVGIEMLAAPPAGEHAWTPPP